MEPIERIDPIFKEFRKNSKGVAWLKDVYQSLSLGSDLMRVRWLQVEETNASCSTKFSNASCATSTIHTELGIAMCSMGILFGDGMEALRRYLNENPCIPDDKPSRKALAKLLKFINSSLNSIEPPQKNDKSEWAAVLAQHLFSKLAVDSKFTLDRHYSQESVKMEDEICGQGDQLAGSFGDTSFGCPGAWHGSVDIFLENIPITVTGSPECRQDRERLQPDSSDNGNKSSVEVKTEETFSDKELGQLVSQCIVFSFLQKNQLADPNVDILVPSIGINTSLAIVHFYDCKNDVLFESARLNLFKNDKELHVSTVVVLWLTLNCRYFCPGISDEMKCFTANFRSIIAGDYLKKYEKETTRPFPSISYINDREREKFWETNIGLQRLAGKKRKRDFIEID